jgi:signal transduction histidine kinase
MPRILTDRFRGSPASRPAGVSLLVLTLAVTFTLIAFTHARTAAMEGARGAFREQAAERTGLLRLELAHAVESIESFGDLIQVRPMRAATNFRLLSRRLLQRTPGLYSVAWSEWVSHEQRAEVVEAIRNDGFEIGDLYSRDEAERPVPAQKGEHYLVVRHMYPTALAPEAVGYDVMSSADRRDIVLRAIDGAAASATGPVRLGADQSGTPAVIVFVPVYNALNVADDVSARRAAFLGTASIGFQIAPALARWLEQHALPLVATVIYDVDDGGTPHILMQHGIDAAASIADVAVLADHPLAVLHTVGFAGREWSVVHVPSIEFDVLWQHAAPPQMILGFGLAMALLLAVLAGVYVRSQDLSRRIAEERAAAAAELTRANFELRALNEDMEHFISAVAHDLRNPLMVIRSVAQLARRQVETKPYEQLADSLDAMERSALTMDRIIDGLVEHARAGYAPFQGETLDLDALVRSIIADHVRDAAQLGACVKVSGTLPTVFGDRSRLAAAFDNLIGNALKYAQPTLHGGPLHITIGCATANDQPAGGYDPAMHWALYVRDNGPGVPPEQRTRIFRAFRRLAQGTGGIGLGLAAVQRTALAHGGCAWVEASPGGIGATFWLTIAREIVVEVERGAETREWGDSTHAGTGADK